MYHLLSIRAVMLVLLMTTMAVQAQEQDSITVYTLDECRQMAIHATHSSEIRAEAMAAARLNRQAALAAMFPKVSMNASYMWNSKSPAILPDELSFNFGTARVAANGAGSFEWSETSFVNRLDQATRSVPSVNAEVKAIGAQSGQMIADLYQVLYEALHPDMTHVVVGQVGLTQPIYVGGRLLAIHSAAKAAERIAEIEADNQSRELIIKTDEAYWRVVSVQQKRVLANQYYDLLMKLEDNVSQLVDEGLATQQDLLKVKAKRGEAEVKKLQAENGLVLSRMALCQVIGLPLYTQFEVDDKGLDQLQLHDTVLINDALLDARPEVQMLDKAEQMAKANVRLMSAGLQPNIVAQANYIYTNPNLENGFSNHWNSTGFFSAGVVVNIPIAHADDILRYKAAKHQANIVALKREEAKELLTLQVTQANQKVLEAQQKVAMTQLQVHNAEEVLRLAQEAFEAGMATASDLMGAQTAWQAACSDHVDALIDARMQELHYKKYTNTLTIE
jgi:outer membrane protein TolC